jgi:hypothetical protein
MSEIFDNNKCESNKSEALDLTDEMRLTILFHSIVQLVYNIGHSQKRNARRGGPCVLDAIG